MSQRSGARCRRVSMRDVRRMPRIASDFETDVVYRLYVETSGTSTTWTLREQQLNGPFRKVYDTGDPNVWLESYKAEGWKDLHFIAAELGGVACGLVTWRVSAWNNTISLLDIRIREDVRRQGVGSALLASLAAEAQGRKARGIFLETQINNVPAIRFYRKHGFEVAGFNTFLYTDRDLEDQDVALFLYRPLAQLGR